MEQFIKLVANLFSQIFGLLNSYSFSMFGYNVSLLGLFLGFIVLGFVTSIFWKGARG